MVAWGPPLLLRMIVIDFEMMAHIDAVHTRYKGVAISLASKWRQLQRKTCVAEVFFGGRRCPCRLRFLGAGRRFAVLDNDEWHKALDLQSG